MTLVWRINSVRRITVEFRTITSKDSPRRRILIFRIVTVARTIYPSKRFLGSKDNSQTSKDVRGWVSVEPPWSKDDLSTSKDIFRWALTHWHRVDRLVKKVMGWCTTFGRRYVQTQLFTNSDLTFEILPKKEASYPETIHRSKPEFWPEITKPFRTRF